MADTASAKGGTQRVDAGGNQAAGAKDPAMADTASAKGGTQRVHAGGERPNPQGRKTPEPRAAAQAVAPGAPPEAGGGGEGGRGGGAMSDAEAFATHREMQQMEASARTATRAATTPPATTSCTRRCRTT